jgi:hypothetical protein
LKARVGAFQKINKITNLMGLK